MCVGDVRSLASFLREFWRKKDVEHSQEISSAHGEMGPNFIPWATHLYEVRQESWHWIRVCQVSRIRVLFLCIGALWHLWRLGWQGDSWFWYVAPFLFGGLFMPREATLFDETNGSVVEGYLLLRQDGGNIPPAWIDRSSAARKKREKVLAQALKENSLDALSMLRDWELAYRKECFYYGIRALMELQRAGKTKL